MHRGGLSAPRSARNPPSCSQLARVTLYALWVSMGSKSREHADACAGENSQHRSRTPASGVSAADAQVFLDGLAALIEPVETHFLWRPRLRDPADEMVLEAAVNGRADVLVTFNRQRLWRHPPSVWHRGVKAARCPPENCPMSTTVTYPLRLPRSIKAAAEQLAKAEGVSLNQLVATGVAEKLAALNTAAFFAERRDRADLAAFRRIVTRPGGQPPQAGDEREIG